MIVDVTTVIFWEATEVGFFVLVLLDFGLVAWVGIYWGNATDSIATVKGKECKGLEEVQIEVVTSLN